MKLLYPQNNYTMSEIVMKYRPALLQPNVRSVSLQSKVEALETRSKFSFAIMEMLKTDPVTKLLFLQDYLTEKRYKNILKVKLNILKFYLLNYFILNYIVIYYILSLVILRFWKKAQNFLKMNCANEA